MEWNPVRNKAEFFRQNAEIIRHIGVAAELTGKRPVGTIGIFNQDADIDMRLRSIFCNIFQIFFTVGNEQPDTFFIKIGNVFCFFNRIPIAETIRSDSQSEDFIKLVAWGDIEIGS